MWIEDFTIGIHVHAEPLEAGNVHEVGIPLVLKFQFLFAGFLLKFFEGFFFFELTVFAVFVLRLLLLVNAVDDAPFQMLAPFIHQGVLVRRKGFTLRIGPSIFRCGIIERLL